MPKICPSLQDVTIQLPVFFSVNQHLCHLSYGLVVKAYSFVLGNMGSNPARCWIFVQPPGHFACYWACQCTDTCSYILLRLAVLSITFSSSVAISPWQSFNSQHKHPTPTVLEYFETSLSLVLPQTRRGPLVQTWHTGCDYSCCIASSFSSCTGCCIFWIVENTEKNA